MKQFRIRILLLVLAVSMLAYCFGCTSNLEQVDASTLDGENISIGQAICVCFHTQGSDSVKTPFILTPLDGAIRIKYVEGLSTTLEARLYDTTYDEPIMQGAIEKIGSTITFTNLLSSHTYSVEILSPDSDLGDTLTLQFSK